MIKNGMAFAALTLAFFATLAHADDYLSPTDERVRLSLGVDTHCRTPPIMQLDSSTGVAGHADQRGERIRIGPLGLRTEISSHGARAASGTGCASIFFSWIAPARPPSPNPIVFRDVVLQPGDPGDTTLSLRTLGITYEYSFIHTREIRARRDHRHQ